MTFREEVHRQAQDARREMVRTKQLLTLNEFCERLGVSERRLARMVAIGSAFSIAVDGVQYFPALLADPTVDRKRLLSVCRILVPAPPVCQLDYLSSLQGNLGDITPLEALGDKKKYRRLREMARAWAAEWSRTAVKIYARPYRPNESRPTYLAVCEGDPRANLWKRAMDVMDAGGYVASPGPYPWADAATVLIVRSGTGEADDIEEARLEVSVGNGIARVLIHTRDFRQEREDVSVPGADSIVEVVRRVIERFCGEHEC